MNTSDKASADGADETGSTVRPLDRATRISAILLAASYITAVLAAGAFVRPLTRSWLVGLALLPGAVGFAFGLPRVARARPRGLLALFHLVLYPLFAVLFLGVPAAYVAFAVARLVGP